MENNGHFRKLVGITFLLSVTTFTFAQNNPTQEPLGHTLEGLIAWVDIENPTLSALRQETEAAHSRIQPAGALPDPTLNIQFMNITNSNVTPDTMALNPNNNKEATMYTVAQTLPFWGKRDLSKKIATAQFTETQAIQWAMAADIYAQVKSNFAQWYEAIHLKEITEETLQVISHIEETAKIRYVQNRGKQQDVINAQLAKTALQSQLIRLEANQQQAQSRLNGILGRKPTASLATPQILPDIPLEQLNKPEILDALINESPILKSQEAKITAAENNRQLVYKNRYPDITVGVSPIQQGGEIIEWGAMLELNIPIQLTTRRSQEHEASSLLMAAKERERAIDFELRSSIEQSLAELNAAFKQDTLLTNTLLPQANLSLDTALAAYRVGEVDFATVLEAQRQIQQIRQESLMFKVQQQQSLAQIEQLLGAFL